MKYQKGQVLLIAVLLLATVLTVTLTVTLKSTTETKLTKLEQESQKTLSAAEAAVEAALQRGNIASSDFGSLGLSNFTGSATVSTASDPNFISPLMQKDQQYTFYLAKPKETSPGVFDFTVFESPYDGDVTLCFGDGSKPNEAPALELTFLRMDNSAFYSIFGIELFMIAKSF